MAALSGSPLGQLHEHPSRIRPVPGQLLGRLGLVVGWPLAPPPIPVPSQHCLPRLALALINWLGSMLPLGISGRRLLSLWLAANLIFFLYIFFYVERQCSKFP